MTALVLNMTETPFVTSEWRVAGDAEQCYVVIVNSQLNPVRLSLSFDEFIQLVSESGKVLDLRKFQSES